MITDYNAGTITLKEPKEISISSEVAAWYTKAELPVGTYQLNVSFVRGKAFVYAKDIEGVITENYTPSLFGGVVTGGRDGSEEVGNPYIGSVGVYQGMLEDNKFVHVELTDEAKEWLTPGYQGEFDYDKEHPAFKKLMFLNEIEEVKRRVVEDKYVYTTSHAKDGGFLDSESIAKALNDGLTASSYIRTIGVDYNLKKYSGKSLKEHGIDMKDAYEFIKGKSGEVSRFLALATKELMDENDINVLKEANDLSY